MLLSYIFEFFDSFVIKLARFNLNFRLNLAFWDSRWCLNVETHVVDVILVIYLSFQCVIMLSSMSCYDIVAVRGGKPSLSTSLCGDTYRPCSSIHLATSSMVVHTIEHSMPWYRSGRSCKPFVTALACGGTHNPCYITCHIPCYRACHSMP